MEHALDWSYLADRILIALCQIKRGEIPEEPQILQEAVELLNLAIKGEKILEQGSLLGAAEVAEAYYLALLTLERGDPEQDYGTILNRLRETLSSLVQNQPVPPENLETACRFFGSFQEVAFREKDLTDGKRHVLRPFSLTSNPA